MSYLDQRRSFIEDGRPVAAKKKYVIPKVSKKRAAKIDQQKELLKLDEIFSKSRLSGFISMVTISLLVLGLISTIVFNFSGRIILKALMLLL